MTIDEILDKPFPKMTAYTKDPDQKSKNYDLDQPIREQISKEIDKRGKEIVKIIYDRFGGRITVERLSYETWGDKREIWKEIEFRINLPRLVRIRVAKDVYHYHDKENPPTNTWKLIINFFDFRYNSYGEDEGRKTSKLIFPWEEIEKVIEEAKKRVPTTEGNIIKDFMEEVSKLIPEVKIGLRNGNIGSTDGCKTYGYTLVLNSPWTTDEISDDIQQVNDLIQFDNVDIHISDPKCFEQFASLIFKRIKKSNQWNVDNTERDIKDDEEAIKNAQEELKEHNKELENLLTKKQALSDAEKSFKQKVKHANQSP
jgi:hypothetical protein